MSGQMTKEEAQTWMARWKLVEERQREELRARSYEDKFRGIALLMASADLFDMSVFEEEDKKARELWTRLQSLARGR